MLRLGFAEVDITPDRPVELVGFHRKDNRSKGVLKPLLAQAAVWDAGERCCLVAADSIGFTEELTNALRERISRILEIPPELFRKLDQCSTRCHPDTAGIIEALGAGDLGSICRRMYNVFEDVDDRRMRTVREIKGRLLDHGALGSVMTGTGSAVFGVFRPGTAPDEALRELRKEYGFCEKAVCVGRTN